MNTKIAAASSAGQRWFSDAIGGAWRLVKQGTKIHRATDVPFYEELCALSDAHMAVLMHKRAKYKGNAPMNLRWFTELDDFVTHMIWPMLSEGSAMTVSSKSDVIEVLDEIVGAGQRRAAAVEHAGNIPHTSRFDTSWVT